MKEIEIQCSLCSFISIIKCDVKKVVNDHGKACISGYIEADQEKSIQSVTTGDQFAAIKLIGEDKTEKVLFAGLVEAVEVEELGDIKVATITLTAGTRLLEGVRRVRSFQDQGLSYDSLVQTVNQSANASASMNVGSGSSIGDMIVQYQENDWEFLKRLASHFEAPIIPNYEVQKVKYQFGLATGKSTQLTDTISYSIGKSKQRYCSFKTRELYSLGQGLVFHNQEYFIYQCESQLVGSELVHTYTMRVKKGFKVKKQYNMRIIGASLDASILSVKNDVVKVMLHVDGSQSEGTAKWFPYSTVYSSPDGTGWYCMPEKGDRVRLYFPTEKEEEGYIISSINTGSQSTSRSNPDNKSISTKYNKQIELTPSTIIMSNNKGMTIKIDDDEGISIVSDKDVVIEAANDLKIKSVNTTMNLEAKESIELIQGDTKFTMKDDITVEGAEFIVQ